MANICTFTFCAHGPSEQIQSLKGQIEKDSRRICEGRFEGEYAVAPDSGVFGPMQQDHFWIDRGDHNSIINSEEAAEAIRKFFDRAKALPVI